MGSFSGKACKQQHFRIVHWWEVGRQLYLPAAVCYGALISSGACVGMNRLLRSGQRGTGQTVGLCPLKSVVVEAGAKQVAKGSRDRWLRGSD